MSPMERTRRARLLQVEAWLRLHFPLDRDVAVRVEKVKGGFGDCTVLDGKFRIRINKEATWYHAIDLLLHEWAHALAWEDEATEHGPEWGVAFAKI